MDLFTKCDYNRLKVIHEMDVYPYFHVLESRQAPVVKMEGRRVIMLEATTIWVSPKTKMSSKRVTQPWISTEQVSAAVVF